MRVLFDYQAFYMQKFGGISNGIVQILSSFPKEVDYEIAIAESDNVHLKRSGLAYFKPVEKPVESFLTNKMFKGKGRLYDMYSKLFPNQTSLGRNRQVVIDKLKEGKFDIFHPTFFNNYFLPYLGNKPFVLTIFDMTPERVGYKDPQVELKRKLAKRANHIATISETSKNDIIDILKVPESKITVIYRGEPQYESSQGKPIIDKKYILFVGKRESYKFFRPMMDALMPVLSNHEEICVVCAGPSFTDDEFFYFKNSKLEDRVINIHPTDSEMMNLYANAICFIYPSIYEGFGIPILEAYKANCPVLLNNKSCFPEIAQDAAIYFNLDQANSDLAITVEQLLQMTENEKNTLLCKQQERLSFFSWRKAALQYQKLYESLL